MTTRREFLGAGGRALACLATLRLGRFLDPRPDPFAGPAREVSVVHMRSDRLGSRVWFDPIGLLVRPGATVRWVVESNAHSTTAYHPVNDDHALRIPPEARPWNSGVLTRPGQLFEWTFTVPGVYDYYCIPHELAGMVGRIVVALPGTTADEVSAPGPATPNARPVPPAALAAFPSVGAILREGSIRLPEPSEA